MVLRREKEAEAEAIFRKWGLDFAVVGETTPSKLDVTKLADGLMKVKLGAGKGFFKIGVDERFAKYSPGVQLTLELTRHLCADPTIASADSTAAPDHPMINPIWRGRFAIGDVLIPLRAHDPAVTMIHAALTARQFARHTVRRAVHVIRSLKSR